MTGESMSLILMTGILLVESKFPFSKMNILLSESKFY